MTAEALPAGLRVGQGFDIHPFAPADAGRPLVLGGVTIPGSPALAGHSDADVVVHALADALLGACCLGDLGRHFPDTDDRWAGVDSMVLLREVMAVVGPHRRVMNADCTILCEKPSLAPHLQAMEDTLGRAVAAPVSVKATRGEGLGAIGRAEGIACLAVALVAAVPPS